MARDITIVLNDNFDIVSRDPAGLKGRNINVDRILVRSTESLGHYINYGTELDGDVLNPVLTMDLDRTEVIDNVLYYFYELETSKLNLPIYNENYELVMQVLAGTDDVKTLSTSRISYTVIGMVDALVSIVPKDLEVELNNKINLLEINKLDKPIALANTQTADTVPESNLLPMINVDGQEFSMTVATAKVLFQNTSTSDTVASATELNTKYPPNEYDPNDPEKNYKVFDILVVDAEGDGDNNRIWRFDDFVGRWFNTGESVQVTRDEFSAALSRIQSLEGKTRHMSATEFLTNLLLNLNMVNGDILSPKLLTPAGLIEQSNTNKTNADQSLADIITINLTLLTISAELSRIDTELKTTTDVANDAQSKANTNIQEITRIINQLLPLKEDKINLVNDLDNPANISTSKYTSSKLLYDQLALKLSGLIIGDSSGKTFTGIKKISNLAGQPSAADPTEYIATNSGGSGGGATDRLQMGMNSNQAITSADNFVQIAIFEVLEPIDRTKLDGSTQGQVTVIGDGSEYKVSGTLQVSTSNIPGGADHIGITKRWLVNGVSLGEVDDNVTESSGATKALNGFIKRTALSTGDIVTLEIAVTSNGTLTVEPGTAIFFDYYETGGVPATGNMITAVYDRNGVGVVDDAQFDGSNTFNLQFVNRTQAMGETLDKVIGDFSQVIGLDLQQATDISTLLIDVVSAILNNFDNIKRFDARTKLGYYDLELSADTTYAVGYATDKAGNKLELPNWSNRSTRRVIIRNAGGIDETLPINLANNSVEASKRLLNGDNQDVTFANLPKSNNIGTQTLEFDLYDAVDGFLRFETTSYHSSKSDNAILADSATVSDKTNIYVAETIGTTYIIDISTPIDLIPNEEITIEFGDFAPNPPFVNRYSPCTLEYYGSDGVLRSVQIIEDVKELSYRVRFGSLENSVLKFRYIGGVLVSENPIITHNYGQDPNNANDTNSQGDVSAEYGNPFMRRVSESGLITETTHSDNGIIERVSQGNQTSISVTIPTMRTITVEDTDTGLSKTLEISSDSVKIDNKEIGNSSLNTLYEREYPITGNGLDALVEVTIPNIPYLETRITTLEVYVDGSNPTETVANHFEITIDNTAQGNLVTQVIDKTSHINKSARLRVSASINGDTITLQLVPLRDGTNIFVAPYHMRFIGHGASNEVNYTYFENSYTTFDFNNESFAIPLNGTANRLNQILNSQTNSPLTRSDLENTANPFSLLIQSIGLGKQLDIESFELPFSMLPSPLIGQFYLNSHPTNNAAGYFEFVDDVTNTKYTATEINNVFSGWDKIHSGNDISISGDISAGNIDVANVNAGGDISAVGNISASSGNIGSNRILTTNDILEYTHDTSINGTTIDMTSWNKGSYNIEAFSKDPSFYKALQIGNATINFNTGVREDNNGYDQGNSANEFIPVVNALSPSEMVTKIQLNGTRTLMFIEQNSSFSSSKYRICQRQDGFTISGLEVGYIIVFRKI